MEVGAITGYIDVAQVALYGFWAFFAGLIVYLRIQDRKEGYYPAVQDTGVPNSMPTDAFPDAPLTPTGDPLLAGIGPGTWGNRADKPELTWEDKQPKIVPLRVAADYFVDPEGVDPRGYTVLGADNVPAGTVSDIWVDRNELLVRFFEIEVTAAAERHVLVPAPLSQVNEAGRTLKVNSILASQFTNVPTTKSPDQITTNEEDYIAAYYSAGTLYATPARLGPLL